MDFVEFAVGHVGVRWLLVVGDVLLVVCFSIGGCGWVIFGCWLLVVSCGLLVVSCWVLVVGCWLLVVGC